MRTDVTDRYRTARGLAGARTMAEWSDGIAGEVPRGTQYEWIAEALQASVMIENERVMKKESGGWISETTAAARRFVERK